jgi:monofunctional biosynthetic peptidoglycan transglycosylase
MTNTLLSARAPAPRRRLRLIVVGLLAIALAGPPIWVLAYRFAPPPVTILMVQRLIEGRGLERHWVPLSQISPAMTRAVIAAEDARFCEHHGFDFEAIDEAMKQNEAHPGTLRGGSTISQQTAKNVFLWPGRSWIRKGLESGYTVLIEALWGKRRIMEVYLNTVEMGPGVYGVEAAARRIFHLPASRLSAE